MISVRTQNLTKRFNEVLALDRVSLDIQPGEVFFLLGPSGCGKTTLLRSLAGFCVPDEGAIFFGEENVTKVPPHKRNTGMMFQSYALWPHMSVQENVAFGLEERRVPKNEIRPRVREALGSIRMEDYAERRISQLSGGQQQRVALARALVVRPRCLLLDEPLSNLDAKLRLEMRGEIRRVCKEFGLTAIYVTHDQKEALSIADRLAILGDGRICQVGSPREVYRHPCSKFVADFIGETNFISGKVASVSDGHVMVSTNWGDFRGIPGNVALKFNPGDSVALSVRPETWKLHVGAPAENAVRGRIADTVYLGEMAQYQFAAENFQLKICELNPRFLEHARDREIYATADPSDVIVLPEDLPLKLGPG